MDDTWVTLTVDDTLTLVCFDEKECFMNHYNKLILMRVNRYKRDRYNVTYVTKVQSEIYL